MDNVKIDMDEFESLFVEKLGKKEISKKKILTKEKSQIVTLLDPKRSMNISIATASIKMSYSDFGSVISSMEEDRLDETQLTQLMENLPTSNEKKKLQEYIEKEGNTESLGNAEKYMAAIINVPFCDERLKSMVFKCQFPGIADEWKSTAELIHVRKDISHPIHIHYVHYGLPLLLLI